MVGGKRASVQDPRSGASRDGKQQTNDPNGLGRSPTVTSKTAADLGIDDKTVRPHQERQQAR
jgi:hypothetical protein